MDWQLVWGGLGFVLIVAGVGMAVGYLIDVVSFWASRTTRRVVRRFKEKRK